MNTLRLALRMLARDWRAGELTVLGLALMLAVAALTSVSFLADRVERALILQAHQMLGGDLLLSADHPWSAEVRAAARRGGLDIAESVSFPSMVIGPAGVALAEVKAVSGNYPLRGRLRIAPALDVADVETRRVPLPGQVWLDDRLARAVAPAAGSRLSLGKLSLSASAVLTLDPERGVNAFALVPRLMIDLADLPATGLIQPGSRVRWRLHLAGEAAAVERFRRWIEPNLGRGERLESIDDARPEMRTMLDRAGRFMRLAALLAVVLSAVATGLAADRYLRRHLDGCAVMRCLGARQGQILAIHGGEFLLFGFLTTLAGCLLGFGAQAVFHSLLAGLLARELPLPGWQPWLHGLLVGLTLVAGFVLPPLLRLRRVPALRVLRREWNGAEPSLLAAYGLGGLSLAALMFWVAGEARLGLVVIGGFVAALLVFGVAARLLLHVLASRRASGAWRLGLANLGRRWRGSVIQVVALALGLTALLLLSVARDDLMASWRRQMPADAPNRFVINLQPDQRAAFGKFLAGHGLTAPLLEPMVRARLVSVNGRKVTAADYTEDRARRLVEREFNLSWASALPVGNTVVAGRWHGDDKQPQFSVEEGLAKTLHLKIGDELGYEIGGVPLSARITSLRKLDWESMRVNFFVIAAPGMLDGTPASYVTSFYLPPQRADLVTALVRKFPNLTVIDVSSIMRQLQDSLDQVARAVQGLFGFAIAAGLVVLLAALQAGADERRRELAVMRALGARRRQLGQLLLAEFLAVGALAGFLAALGAGAIGFALGRLALHLPYVPSPWLLPIGLAVGAGGVAIVGWWAMRGVLRRPINADLLAY